MRKNPASRKAPLIFDRVRRRFCVTRVMCAGSSTRLCRTLPCPEGSVFSGVGTALWAGLADRGQPGVAGNKKDTSSLRRGV